MSKEKQKKEKKCPFCYGEGKRICSSCNGLGLSYPNLFSLGFHITCCSCGGTGKTMCTYCSGTGKDITISFKM